jgi:hypothetical protein
MANKLAQNLIKLHLTSNDCAFREGDIEEEGTIPDINNEILHPTIQTQQQRWLVTRKRPFSPPPKMREPSENESIEDFDSPKNRTGSLSCLNLIKTPQKITKQGR